MLTGNSGPAGPNPGVVANGDDCAADTDIGRGIRGAPSGAFTGSPAACGMELAATGGATTITGTGAETSP